MRSEPLSESLDRLAERERQREERMARLVIRRSRSHWLSFDEMMGGLFLRGME